MNAVASKRVPHSSSSDLGIGSETGRMTSMDIKNGKTNLKIIILQFFFLSQLFTFTTHICRITSPHRDG